MPEALYPTFAAGPSFAEYSAAVRPAIADRPAATNVLTSLSIDTSGLSQGQPDDGEFEQAATDKEPNDEPTVAEWHRRLDELFTAGPVEGAAAPHTRVWLTKHNYFPPWGYRQSKHWAWGSPGYTALDNWLGADWHRKASPLVHYGSNDVQAPYPVAVYAAGECLALGDKTSDAGVKWMPLGVFGLLPPREWSFVTTVQLAVNQDGVIRGFAMDTETKRISEVKGGIDRATLRLAFEISGTRAGIFETTAADLLQSESPINVYNPVDQTVDTWQVFRDYPQ